MIEEDTFHLKLVSDVEKGSTFHILLSLEPVAGDFRGIKYLHV